MISVLWQRYADDEMDELTVTIMETTSRMLNSPQDGISNAPGKTSRPSSKKVKSRDLTVIKPCWVIRLIKARITP